MLIPGLIPIYERVLALLDLIEGTPDNADELGNRQCQGNIQRFISPVEKDLGDIITNFQYRIFGFHLKSHSAIGTDQSVDYGIALMNTNTDRINGEGLLKKFFRLYHIELLKIFSTGNVINFGLWSSEVIDIDAPILSGYKKKYKIKSGTSIRLLRNKTSSELYYCLLMSCQQVPQFELDRFLIPTLIGRRCRNRIVMPEAHFHTFLSYIPLQIRKSHNEVNLPTR